MKKVFILVGLLIFACNTDKKGIFAYNVNRGGKKGVYIKDAEKKEVIAKYIPESSFEFYSVYGTFDLNNDGAGEIIIEHYSGGAHCCTDYIVFDISKNYLNKIWNFDAGNGGILKIDDIDGDGINEIITACDCLSYFADLPYAVSPSLPRIFKYKKGKFIECTMEYPWVFDTYVEEFCKGIKEAENDGEEKGNYLGIVAIYMLKGKPFQGYLKAEKCGASIGTINWFYYHRDELFETLKKHYHF